MRAADATILPYMRLVTFQGHANAEPGVLIGENIVGIRGAGYADTLSVIAGGAEALARVEKWTQKPPDASVVAARGVKLHAPLPRPPKILCVGLNYRAHARESNMEVPEFPTVFTKLPTAAIGSGETIVLPKKSSKPDYEAELAFVIGKRGRHIEAGSWREYVFGYMNLNDVSARDYQLRTSQWMIGKSFDTFAPMGPAIVTADEVPDPHALDISTTINGEVLQDSNTSDLIFKIPELIAYLSSVCTLEPGDVISTGTPSGVGAARTPPRWLRPGDDVVIRVQGLGELRNPVAAE